MSRGARDARGPLAGVTGIVLLMAAGTARADDAAPTAVHVQVDAGPGLTVMNQTPEMVTVPALRRGRYGGGRAHDEHVYAPLCPAEGAACDTKVEPGAHMLALKLANGTLVKGDEPVAIEGPSRVQASLVDRSGTRAAGILAAVAGGVGGFTLLAFGIQSDKDDHGQCNGTCTGEVGVGLALLFGMAFVTPVLIGTEDEARFSVSPLLLNPVSAREGGGQSVMPSGVEVSVRF
jgi:hypothetical protein